VVGPARHVAAARAGAGARAHPWGRAGI